MALVGGGRCERSGSKTDSVCVWVEDGIEPFKEGETVNEIEALSRIGAQIANDEQNVIGGTTNSGVELFESY